MGVLEDLAAQLGISTTQLRDNLLSNQQVNEALIPSYLTVNAQGQVGANFTGQINAQGLIIPEATKSTYSFLDSVTWEDAASTVQEFLQGSSAGGFHKLLAGVTNAPAILTLLDQTGASSFLQLTVPGLAQINYGQGTFNGNGTAQVANVTQAHSLGRTPIAIAGIPARNRAAGTTWTGDCSETTSPAGGNISLTMSARDGVAFVNGTQYAFYWLAIG